MDYVYWCDEIAVAIANHARDSHGNYINLHLFASEFAESKGLPMSNAANNAIILGASEILKVSGIYDNGPMIHIKYSVQDQLRDSYSRWRRAANIQVSGESRVLLDTLNRLSPIEEVGYTTVNRVDIGSLLAEAALQTEAGPLNEAYAREQLDKLESFGLVYSQKFIGSTYYESSYLGVARTSREFVEIDSYIDELRGAGEGDTLDYKRVYRLNSDKDNFTFAKDVISLANAGGLGPRHILVGVEDDGSFYMASDLQTALEHRNALDQLTETRLQQIVSSRSIPTPSIRLAGRGEHRGGPYVLIEVNPDPSARPYRVFSNPQDRNAPNALEVGKVWIRKGSTNDAASEAEIKGLISRARVFQQFQAGSS